MIYGATTWVERVGVKEPHHAVHRSEMQAFAGQAAGRRLAPRRDHQPAQLSTVCGAGHYA